MLSKVLSLSVSLSLCVCVCLSVFLPPAPSPSLSLEMTYFRWILYTSTCMPCRSYRTHFRCLVLYSLLGLDTGLWFFFESGSTIGLVPWVSANRPQRSGLTLNSRLPLMSFTMTGRRVHVLSSYFCRYWVNC